MTRIDWEANNRKKRLQKEGQEPFFKDSLPSVDEKDKFLGFFQSQSKSKENQIPYFSREQRQKRIEEAILESGKIMEEIKRKFISDTRDAMKTKFELFKKHFEN